VIALPLACANAETDHSIIHAAKTAKQCLNALSGFLLFVVVLFFICFGFSY
jgi:hypothetical protein